MNADPMRAARRRSRFKLLGLLIFLLVFWALMMVAMYYSTIYPRLHHHPVSGGAVDAGGAASRP